MNYESQGRITAKLEKRQVSDKFVVQEFAIEIQDGQYSQVCKFQASNKAIEYLDKVGIGAEVKLTWNLRGRRFEKDGKVSYFNSLDAWKIESVGGSQSQPAPAQEPEFDRGETPDDGLPF